MVTVYRVFGDEGIAGITLQMLMGHLTRSDNGSLGFVKMARLYQDFWDFFNLQLGGRVVVILKYLYNWYSCSANSK